LGRPRKVNQTTGKVFRTDRELVYAYQHSRKKENKDAAAFELWEKYFKLRMKMKHELIALCVRNNLYMPEIIEEYDSEAWIKFIEQMDGVRLNDVAHIENWSIYIRLWGYWRSMNRDLLKHWFDWKKNTTPIYSLNSDKSENIGDGLTNIDVFEAAHNGDKIQSDIELNSAREIFWEAIEELKKEISPKQYNLINMKYQGKKNREIIKTLQINNKILNEQLLFIKGKLENIIVQVAKQKGNSGNYNEIIEALN
jgi:hypothetical protein